MCRTRFVCSTLLALICASVVVAQETQPPPAQSGAGGPAAARGNVKPAELANALDQYALVQAQRTLQLTDAQYLQFVPRLKTLQQARRRNQQARNRIIHQLRQLAGPRAAAEPDEATLTQHLTALREQEDRASRELRSAHDAVDEVLTAKQRARFRIFEENLEVRKLDLLMRARARAGEPGGH
jgi:Spy/CpxP family protein refolding chaperone